MRMFILLLILFLVNKNESKYIVAVLFSLLIFLYPLSIPIYIYSTFCFIFPKFSDFIANFQKIFINEQNPMTGAISSMKIEAQKAARCERITVSTHRFFSRTRRKFTFITCEQYSYYARSRLQVGIDGRDWTLFCRASSRKRSSSVFDTRQWVSIGRVQL